MSQTNRSLINRRTALVRIAGGIATTAAAPHVLLAREPNPKRLGEIRQVTTEEFDHSNIYCEVPFCSRSSRWFVYERTNPKLKVNRTELMAVNLGTWKQERLDTTVDIGGLAITDEGILYYLKRTGKGDLDLMQADLDRGQPQRVYRRQDERWVHSLGTVSADGRFYAGGVMVGKDWSEFGILLVDLEKGTEVVIDRDPFILNPHPQFDPGNGKRLLIQHNRGGKYRPDGHLEKLVGEEGATLYVLSVPDGKRTTLPVGKPETTPCTGHETWIGRTGEVLLSVAASGDFRPEKGNLLRVGLQGRARVAARGYNFNHVGVSRCGEFFTGDDWQPPFKIVIGSLRTGKTVVACESGSRPDRRQNSHPHAYLTPDLKWVIFNSNRSGFAHIYAAAVGEEVLTGLLKV